MTLPTHVMVYEAKESDGTTYLVACENIEEAMTDVPHHKPRVVGIYKLTGNRRVVNVVQSAPITRKKAGKHGR